jgi:uncharacterized protein (TIGR03437 family)
MRIHRNPEDRLFTLRFWAFAVALAGILPCNATAGMPAVGGVLNNYSYMLPGLPNYGIAQGSIFAIFGTNLASATEAMAPPLQSTVNGVTIDVSVNGTITHPLLYYISPTQINAVLPSATPVGEGSVTVANSSAASASFPIQVVAGAFGLLTSNNGSGQALGFDVSNDGALFGLTQAVNPGEVLELWGTGLGAVANDATDVSVTAKAQVFIGGVAANVLYAGRSGYTGLDQINVQVPAGASGCYVSVAVETGSYISNFATLPVAASGRTCSDISNPLPASLLQKISQTGSADVGTVGLSQGTPPIYDLSPGGTSTGGYGAFVKMTGAQLSAGAAAGGAVAVSSGSCVVKFSTVSGGPLFPPTLFQLNYLDAGPGVYIAGPDGELTATPLTASLGIGAYAAGNATSLIPDSGGSFSFSNGAGGPDVGPFNTSLRIPTSGTWPAWSNTSDLGTITRANGLTVTWTGGDPSTYVSITGTSYGGVNGSLAGYFTCLAPTGAGAFTVPPAVLLSLPVSFGAPVTEDYLSSTVSLSNVSVPVPFAAAGLDAAWAQYAVAGYSTLVVYQ